MDTGMVQISPWKTYTLSLMHVWLWATLIASHLTESMLVIWWLHLLWTMVSQWPAKILQALTALTSASFLAWRERWATAPRRIPSRCRMLPSIMSIMVFLLIVAVKDWTLRCLATTVLRQKMYVLLAGINLAILADQEPSDWRALNLQEYMPSVRRLLLKASSCIRKVYMA